MQKMWMGMNAFHSTARCCFSTVDSLNSKVSAASICCQLFYFGPAFTVIQNDDVFFPQMTVSKMDLDSTETHKVNTQP